MERTIEGIRLSGLHSAVRKVARPRALAPVVLALAAGTVGAAPIHAGEPAVAPDTLQVAPQASDTLRLSVDQAVARALEAGEEVAIAQEETRAAEQEIRQIRAQALPQVETELGYTRTLRSVFDQFGAGEPPPGEDPPEDVDEGFQLPFGQDNEWTAGLRVTQLLWTGGQVRAATEAARRGREMSRLQLEEAEGEVMLDVRRAYFQAVFAEQLVEIARESLELAEDQLRQMERFEEQGKASDFDVMNARVERDNQRPQLVDAENARELAVLDLKRLAQIPRETEVVLTTPLEAELVDVDEGELRAALAHRPSFQALEERIGLEDNRVDAARATRYPQVSAFANFQAQSFPQQVFPHDADVFDDWNVGVQVSFSLFDGFRRSGEIEEARALRRRAELERNQAEESLALELEGALSRFEAALAEVEARRGTVQEAERALELAELRFEAGSATALELSNSRLQLERARINEVEALRDYIDALAEMERATGGTVPLLEPRLRSGAGGLEEQGEDR